MKIRNLFSATAICAIFALAGCAGKKELAGGELAPASATATAPATAPTPAEAKGAAEANATAVAGTSIASDDLSRGAGANEGAAKRKGNPESVYFDFDAYLLSAQARDTLTRNAALLKESKQAKVVIEGHADERGSDEYNLALAEKRATAVQRYLQSLGVSQDGMEIISYGEDKPAVAGHDESAWAKNRRVDFVGAK